MANGFFLGGAAEGAMSAQKQALAEQTQAQDVGLRSRGLDLQESQFANTVSQQAQAEADKRIAETMAVVGETIKNATAVGRPPETVLKAVMPLVQSAQTIAARAGRDPDALIAQVHAQLTAPGAVETAGVAGRAAGTQRIEQARTEQNQPAGTAVEISPFKEEKDRISAENSLRDDFVKASNNFVIIRDFFDRIKTAPVTGAGDLALVFSYMKMLDPPSTVREGEQASAANAAGVPESVRAMYNKVTGGGNLSQQARDELKAAADKIWTGSLNRHSSQVSQYTNIAKRQGLRPANVVVDLTAGSEGPGAPMSGTTSTGIKWNWPGTGP